MTILRVVPGPPEQAPNFCVRCSGMNLSVVVQRPGPIVACSDCDAAASAHTGGWIWWRSSRAAAAGVTRHEKVAG